jgi:tetratricopeptide (TPR) repeat protein
MIRAKEFAAISVKMPSHHPPDTAEVRAVLTRILASDGFSGGAQLAAFLRHIVEETLAGRSERIKAYTIGVEALGRPASFDPQRDPIVRVEANRLRQALATYYAGPGSDEDIIVEVPRGRYVPTFRRRTAVADQRSDETPATAHPWVRRWRTIAAAVLVAAAVLAMALVWLTVWKDPPDPVAGGTFSVPVLVLDPVQPTSAAAEPLATELSRELATVFRYVQSISVVSGPAAEVAANTTSAGELRNFRLDGRADMASDGSATVTLRLDYDGTVAWTRDWLLPAGRKHDIATIAREAAHEVGRAFGVMHARVRADRERLGPGYRCLLAAADSLRRFDLSQHIRVRECLERTTADNPDFALAFGLLAFVYEREYLHDLPGRADEPAPLERSMKAARRMLELWPTSAVAHVALMENLYLRGDLTGAFAAGEKALRLNPIDSTVSGMVGLRLFLGGDTERGAKLLAKSETRFGSNAAAIEFGLFCAAYMAGDMLAASRHAPIEDEVTFPYGLVAQALVAAANGDRDRALRSLDRLTAAYPGWSDPRAMLARFVRSEPILDRLSTDLAAIRKP